MQHGERQVAPVLDGIRRDHRARYEWAARTLAAGSRVLDVGCGVGYGAFILAEAGHTVVALDRDAEAIEYARTHYAHANIVYRCADAADMAGCGDGAFDTVTCFETIEHLQDPLPMLRAARTAAPVLLASVPNEKYFPFAGHKFHFRHYTRHQFERLLRSAGFFILDTLGQHDTESEVGPMPGRTLVVSARRAEVVELRRPSGTTAEAAAPGHVVILGLGPSLLRYVDHVMRRGGRTSFADEIWAINALGDVVQCDRIFHMDDVRVQEARAAAAPASNIAAMLAWMKSHPGPIYTSRPKDDYPGLVAYPLEDVINSTGYAYFNSTAAYAVAFALHLGVRKISLFGIDFTYPNAHHAERGRACVEFWLGLAAARGVELQVSDGSSLLDMCEPPECAFYGYDTLGVDIATVDGGAKVTFSERAPPSAAEIEARYDHSLHPSPLLRGDATAA